MARAEGMFLSMKNPTVPMVATYVSVRHGMILQVPLKKLHDNG